MAETKKATVKANAKAVVAKAEAKKNEAAAAVETTKVAVKKEAAAVKETAKKTVAKETAAAKKTAVKEAAAVKETAKKATTAAKKTAAKATTAAKKVTKKAEVKETVSIQFSDKTYTTEDLVRIAKDVWKYDLKQKASDFKTVDLYVKPEESLAYYVINGEVTGSFLI